MRDTDPHFSSTRTASEALQGMQREIANVTRALCDAAARSDGTFCPLNLFCPNRRPREPFARLGHQGEEEEEGGPITTHKQSDL